MDQKVRIQKLEAMVSKLQFDVIGAEIDHAILLADALVKPNNLNSAQVSQAKGILEVSNRRLKKAEELLNEAKKGS